MKEEKEKKEKKESRETVLARGALWSPLGWPNSRTAAFQEARAESDQYGQLLTAGELRLWRAQDQEGTKADAQPLVSGLMLEREEAVEWRESLREHFREPMQCEVREKMLGARMPFHCVHLKCLRIVKVNLKIRFLPDNTLEAADLTNLLQLASPRCFLS